MERGERWGEGGREKHKVMHEKRERRFSDGKTAVQIAYTDVCAAKEDRQKERERELTPSRSVAPPPIIQREPTSLRYK